MQWKIDEMAIGVRGYFNNEWCHYCNDEWPDNCNVRRTNGATIASTIGETSVHDEFLAGDNDD